MQPKRKRCDACTRNRKQSDAKKTGRNSATLHARRGVKQKTLSGKWRISRRKSQSLPQSWLIPLSIRRIQANGGLSKRVPSSTSSRRDSTRRSRIGRPRLKQLKKQRELSLIH